jgi:hypothetical protein
MFVGFGGCVKHVCVVIIMYVSDDTDFLIGTWIENAYGTLPPSSSTVYCVQKIFINESSNKL